MPTRDFSASSEPGSAAASRSRGLRRALLRRLPWHEISLSVTALFQQRDIRSGERNKRQNTREARAAEATLPTGGQRRIQRGAQRSIPVMLAQVCRNIHILGVRLDEIAQKASGRVHGRGSKSPHTYVEITFCVAAPRIRVLTDPSSAHKGILFVRPG